MISYIPKKKKSAQKSVVLLYTKNEQSKKKLIKMTLYKRIKCLGISLTKELKDLYIQNMFKGN